MACVLKFDLRRWKAAPIRLWQQVGFVLILLLTLGALVQAADTTRTPSREAAATLVIYNSRDPASKSLADYYAQKHAIPPKQVVGLDCPLEETITRKDYADTIETPLRRIFEQENWWKVRTEFDGKRSISANRIRFVALMRGMPLRIQTVIPPPEPDKPPPPRPNEGDPVRSRDEASVDSELSALGDFNSDSFGLVMNPYYQRFTPIMDSAMAAGMLLVCRLDAPTEETVRRMIDDGLEAERDGLFGWVYIDRRSIADGGYKDGDNWLLNAAAECWSKGVPVILDNLPAIFPTGFPVTNAALYYGWYEGAIAGAMATGDLRFQRGAIAVHIHSFSAATLRNPTTGWVAPLVTRGAAASLGNVYEPYLDLTAHLDIFNDRLFQGFTLAESAYMAQKALSWMNVVVGDPLYRPFATSKNLAARQRPSEDAAPWITLGEQLRKASRGGLAQGLYLGKLARESPTGLNYEALGMLQSFNGEASDALESLETATSRYKNSADAFRTIIERLRLMQALGRKEPALRLIAKTLQRSPSLERTQLLTFIKNEISPPPPPPPTAPTSKKP